MVWQDLINAAFGGGMAFAILPSVLKLRQDKQVLGLHWFHVAFPTVWSCWNLYYYPWLDQTFSYWAAIPLTGINVVYLSMLFYYLKWPGGRQEESSIVIDRKNI